MSSRIAVFNDGVIQQLAAPSVLYEEPENTFVAQFIGENNRLHGTVEACHGEFCEVALDDGETVRALKVNVDGAGGPTTLSLRPERVAIEPNGTAADNVVSGRVEELIYLGDHIRARLTVAGNDEFIVKVPNAHGHALLGEGARVRLGWAAEDCRALDASGTAPAPG